jgi:hypothetical protein
LLHSILIPDVRAAPNWLVARVQGLSTKPTI